MALRSGQKLLRFDRKLGARLVAGTDEAGRGSLAGPLVVAGVLLDYGCLRDHKVRPLALLNDSKQCPPERRESPVPCRPRLRRADRRPRDPARRRSTATGCTSRTSPRCGEILHALSPPAEACLVDGFRLGPNAPEHQAVIDGDEKSAAIAAASIVAKVTRDRVMRRMDAIFPHYGFSSHVGYITPSHSAKVRERGPSRIHRRSFQALCYLSEEELAALPA